ncbi:MAG: TrmH family RNA methyltransferase [Croceivirga sp.]
MVGKKWLKLIKSLHQKKYRIQHQLFFVEGKKLLSELLNGQLRPVKIVTLKEFEAEFEHLGVEVANQKEFSAISALKSPNGVLGVFEIPKPRPIEENDWVVALDDVRDPGNLGTIVRLCDWYGIKHLICSPSTVDFYSPKVLQATMGSMARVNVAYTALDRFFDMTNLPIYGAFMNGENVCQEKLPQRGVLVMGNEANGISITLESQIKRKIGIPQFGGATTESLNVAMATGILLNEIRRGQFC